MCMNTLTTDQYTEQTEALPLGDKDAILETLYELGLQEESYVVIGGASMVLRGIKTHTIDIDMLVSDACLQILAERPGAVIKKPPLRAIHGGATNSTVWIRDSSTPLPISATDELGDGYYPLSFYGVRHRAETVSFVPCIPLDDVVRAKEVLQRPKDILDLEAIAAFTGKTLKLPTPEFTFPFAIS